MKLIRPPKHLSTDGFTIVELMIASLIFSLILTVMTAGILHFTTDYYRGINNSTTQTVAATITSDVAQAVQLGKISDVHSGQQKITGNTWAGYICTSSKEFVFFYGTQEPAADSGAFVFDSLGTCYSELALTSDPNYYQNAANWSLRQDLLQPHMRLADLRLSNVAASPSSRNLIVKVAYGDYDLLCAPTAKTNSCMTGNPGLTPGDLNSLNVLRDLQCRSETGSQFCSVAGLSTTVTARIE